jgi:flagellar motor switch protein FliN/FliY
MDDGEPIGGAFTGVPIEIRVSVGRVRTKLRDLLKLRRDAVLPLESRIDDPVELYVGDRLVARGDLVEMEGDGGGRLAVRLIEITDRAPEV